MRKAVRCDSQARLRISLITRSGYQETTKISQKIQARETGRRTKNRIGDQYTIYYIPIYTCKSCTEYGCTRAWRCVPYVTREAGCTVLNEVSVCRRGASECWLSLSSSSRREISTVLISIHHPDVRTRRARVLPSPDDQNKRSVPTSPVGTPHSYVLLLYRL